MGDLGKLIIAKSFKNLPKSNKSSNLVTLLTNICEQCDQMLKVLVANFYKVAQ